MLSETDAETILAFWLDEVGQAGWYVQDEAVDRVCRARFGAHWQAARDGGLRGWLAAPRGALAYLILTDQFPRNMHRGRADAFATDALARSAATLALARGHDLALARGHDLAVAEPERQFFYLPLEHSERLPDQERAVRLFMTRMPETGAEPLRHAILHRDVIRRFGRFPSRNAALGRRDTAAELAYRREGGYMG